MRTGSNGKRRKDYRMQNLHPEKANALRNADAGTRKVASRPIFEGQDIAAMVLATLMALGPLAAFALGFGT